MKKMRGSTATTSALPHNGKHSSHEGRRLSDIGDDEAGRICFDVELLDFTIVYSLTDSGDVLKQIIRRGRGYNFPRQGDTTDFVCYPLSENENVETLLASDEWMTQHSYCSTLTNDLVSARFSIGLQSMKIGEIARISVKMEQNNQFLQYLVYLKGFSRFSEISITSPVSPNLKLGNVHLVQTKTYGTGRSRARVEEGSSVIVALRFYRETNTSSEGPLSCPVQLLEHSEEESTNCTVCHLFWSLGWFLVPRWLEDTLLRLGDSTSVHVKVNEEIVNHCPALSFLDLFKENRYPSFFLQKLQENALRSIHWEKIPQNEVQEKRKLLKKELSSLALWNNEKLKDTFFRQQKNDECSEKSNLVVHIKLLGVYPKEKDQWAMTVSEKLEAIEKYKILGNVLLQRGWLAQSLKCYQMAYDICRFMDVYRQHIVGPLPVSTASSHFYSDHPRIEDEQRGKEEQGANDQLLLFLSVHLNLAHCYLSTANYREVVKHADSALKIDTGNVKALYRKGIAHQKLGDLEEAIACLTQAATLSSGDLLVLSALSQARADMSTHRDAQRKMMGRVLGMKK